MGQLYTSRCGCGGLRVWGRNKSYIGEYAVADSDLRRLAKACLSSAHPCLNSAASDNFLGRESEGSVALRVLLWTSTKPQTLDSYPHAGAIRLEGLHDSADQCQLAANVLGCCNCTSAEDLLSFTQYAPCFAPGQDAAEP
jgi:hypothetical protein